MTTPMTTTASWRPAPTVADWLPPPPTGVSSATWRPTTTMSEPQYGANAAVVNVTPLPPPSSYTPAPAAAGRVADEPLPG